MIEEMGWSRSTFSSMYSAASLSAAAFMIVIGRSIDRFGARRTLATLVVLMGLVTIWMSTVDSEWKLLIGLAGIRTIGQGSFGLVGATLISIWFIKIRGRANAISSIGGSLSMAIFPFLVHIMIREYGWRTSWIILGLMVWSLLLLPSIFLVRRSPEEVGLLPDGTTSDYQVAGRDQRSLVSEVNFSMNEALKTKALWMLTLSSISMPLIMTGLMFHHVSILDSKGFSSEFAAVTMGLFGPLTLILHLLWGYLSDKIPNRYLLASGNLCLIFTMFWLMSASNNFQIIFYVVLLSISGSAIYTTNIVVWANYFGRSQLGTIRGFAATTMVAFSALGALPFGLIYDQTGSYDNALKLLILMPVLSLIGSLMATPPTKAVTNTS